MLLKCLTMLAGFELGLQQFPLVKRVCSNARALCLFSLLTDSQLFEETCSGYVRKALPHSTVLLFKNLGQTF